MDFRFTISIWFCVTSLFLCEPGHNTVHVPKCPRGVSPPRCTKLTCKSFCCCFVVVTLTVVQCKQEICSDLDRIICFDRKQNRAGLKVPWVSHEAGPGNDRVQFSTSTNQPNFVKVGSELRESSQFYSKVSLITRRMMKPECSITVSVLATKLAVWDLGLYPSSFILCWNCPSGEAIASKRAVKMANFSVQQHLVSRRAPSPHGTSTIRILHFIYLQTSSGCWRLNKQKQVGVNITVLILVHRFISPWSSG